MIEMHLDLRNIRIHVKMTENNELPVIVFLHGFTGSTKTWEQIVPFFEKRYRIVLIDLTGHGETSIPELPERYTMEEQAEDLEAVFTVLQIKQMTLVGYSMGGRIALGYTLRYPQRVNRLILESASPGLAEESARQDRQVADQKLADFIENEGISSFVNKWESIPLFETQKKLSEDIRRNIRLERLSQDTLGLANSLRGIGTGSQPSYWGDLKNVVIPVLLLTGERDKKFVFISREMASLFPQAAEKTISGAGHAIHVEKPALFATIIKEFLNDLQMEEEKL